MDLQKYDKKYKEFERLKDTSKKSIRITNTVSRSHLFDYLRIKTPKAQ